MTATATDKTKPSLILGALVGSGVGLVVAYLRLRFGTDATGPGGSFEGMDPRFPGMGIAILVWNIPIAIGLAVVGAGAGATVMYLLGRRRAPADHREQDPDP